MTCIKWLKWQLRMKLRIYLQISKWVAVQKVLLKIQNYRKRDPRQLLTQKRNDLIIKK